MQVIPWKMIFITTIFSKKKKKYVQRWAMRVSRMVVFFWQFLVSQCRLGMKYRIVRIRRNEQGDIVIKSLKGARRRIRALRSNARNKRPKQAKRIRNAGSKELKSCLEKERRYGQEKRAERAYEELWRLAKSLGFALGENYSRYEFTVGAGSQGKRTVKGEREWEGTTDNGRAPGQIRLERIAVGLNKLRNPSGEPI